MKIRDSGILLHVTSLPSSFGVGDLGSTAYGFVDLLASAGHGLWQILPINPTETVHDSSPYHAYSAFAGNPVLISPEGMVREGLIDRGDLDPVPAFPAERVDHEAVAAYKRRILDLAHRSLDRRRPDLRGDLGRFCDQQAGWLDDFALFAALKRHHGEAWHRWPRQVRDRTDLAPAAGALAAEVDREKFLQWLFFRQWEALREHARSKDVRILGDMPIYVTHDSADVWANRELFDLDDEGMPVHVAGVPPDYFSETGQRWGNPVYRWDAMGEGDYAWWTARIARNLELFDLVRVDHFRGFVGFWRVDAGEETAENGEWVQAPALDFFRKMTRRFSPLPLVAEDLGTVTPDVREVMQELGLPGMRVLEFALAGGGAENTHWPHNHDRSCVVYTGTHDNDTVRGWYENELDEQGVKTLDAYLGKRTRSEDVHEDLVRMALASVASTAVLPLQDVLGLGAEARMNRPGRPEGNWRFRVTAEQLDRYPVQRMRRMLELYGRT